MINTLEKLAKFGGVGRRNYIPDLKFSWSLTCPRTQIARDVKAMKRTLAQIKRKRKKGQRRRRTASSLET